MTSQYTELPQNFEKKETRGRKRLLKRDDILDGALFIGLDNLTMKNLAEHLKVGTATLYQYFENRETLLMEAAEYSIKLLPFPDYKGQGWQQMALEYTKNVQKILKQHPSFIHSHPVTDYGYKIHFTLTEKILTDLVSCGLDAKQAIKVAHIITMASYGGAVEAIRQERLPLNGANIQSYISSQFKEMDSEEFPILSENIEDFILSAEDKTDFLLKIALANIQGEFEE